MKSVTSLVLTRNRGEIFWIHRKIGCLNFEPQYLLNYSSPKKDLYSVRKRSVRAFKSIFKLLGTGSGICAKTLHASCFCLLFSMFQNILRPVSPNVDTSGLKGPETKNGKMENLQLFFLNFLSHFLDFGDITSIFREKALNAMQYCLKILFKSLLYHTVGRCL